MAWRRAWPPMVAPWVMLNAPRQLLQSGVRAVETTTASGISTIYRIRTQGPHTCARTVGALLPIKRETGPNSPSFAGRVLAPGVRRARRTEHHESNRLRGAHRAGCRGCHYRLERRGRTALWVVAGRGDRTTLEHAHPGTKSHSARSEPSGAPRRRRRAGPFAADHGHSSRRTRAARRDDALGAARRRRPAHRRIRP